VRVSGAVLKSPRMKKARLNKLSEMSHEKEEGNPKEKGKLHDLPKFHPHQSSRIEKTLAVMSGKGGVGKSAITALIAITLRRRGYEVGIFDADVTGPSIPKSLGIKGEILVSEEGMVPRLSSTGIKVISMNLILPREDEAVIWRGPLISNAIGQFYEQTIWGVLDFLLIDLPPGTADVPLTIMQSIPLNGIIMVTSPQELAGMIVAKAARMASLLDAPVLGLIENMSYMTCPHCGGKIEPFGNSNGDDAARKMGIPFLGRLPLEGEVSRLADDGNLESFDSEEIENVMGSVADLIGGYREDEK